MYIIIDVTTVVEKRKIASIAERYIIFSQKNGKLINRNLYIWSVPQHQIAYTCKRYLSILLWECFCSLMVKAEASGNARLYHGHINFVRVQTWPTKVKIFIMNYVSTVDSFHC